MPTKRIPEGKKTRGPDFRQISFSVEPGTKVQITIDVGEKSLNGQVPLTVQIEQVTEEQHHAEETSQPVHKPVHVPIVMAGRLRAGFDALKSRLKIYDLGTWLFIFAVTIYLVTRLIGLTRFPIYFFTDEAIQS